MKIQGVIFDLGSTLFRFGGDWSEIGRRSLEALADELERRGLRLRREHFLRDLDRALHAYYQRRDEDYVEHSTASVLREVLSSHGVTHPGDSLIRSALKAMYAVSEQAWEPMPGMHEVLQALRDSGRRLGMISNAGDSHNVQRLIDKAGIRPYFDPILISAQEGIRKPHPKLFAKVLAAWQLPPERVVMVGDLLEADILGAQRAGIHQIWLKEEAAPIPESPAIIPEAEAESLRQVPDIIRQLEAKG